MNLFESILKKASPIQNPVENFMSGFTPSKPQAPMPTKQSKPSFISQANAGEPLVSDKEIEEMIKQGATDSEIEMIVSQLEKERSQTSPQAPQTQQPEQGFMQKASNFLDKGGDAIMNVVGGAVEQAPRVLGNIYAESSKAGAYTPMAMASAAIRAPFSEKTYGQLREEQKQAGQGAKKLGEQGAQFVQKYGEYNPESTGAAFGRMGTNILATIAGPGKIFKTTSEANLAIKALAGLANTSIEGTTAAVSNYVATEGRMPTAKEVGSYIAIQGGLKGIGKLADTASIIPTSRIVPTTPTQLGKDIQKGLEIGRAVRDTGVSVSKKSVIQKIDQRISSISGIIDNEIQKVMKVSGPKNITIGKVTDEVKASIMDNPEIKAKLQGTPIDMKDIQDGINETIDAYKNLYKNKKFDLAGQQQLKKDIYNGLKATFKKADTAKLTAREVTETQIAKNLKQRVEKEVPGIKELNQKLAPYMEASARMKAKGGYSGYLTDILAGGFASGNPQGIIQDPKGYIVNFLTGVAAKRAGTSTLAKTLSANLLKQIDNVVANPAFIKALQDQYRQSNQK